MIVKIINVIINIIIIVLIQLIIERLLRKCILVVCRIILLLHICILL